MTEVYEITTPAGEKANLVVDIGLPQDIENYLKRNAKVEINSPPIILSFDTDSQEIEELLKESRVVDSLVAKKDGVIFTLKTQEKHIDFVTFQLLAAFRKYTIKKKEI